MVERLTLWTLGILERVRDLRREEGQAVVEYGVLLALILVAALVFIPGVGTEVGNAFDNVLQKLQGAGGS